MQRDVVLDVAFDMDNAALKLSVSPGLFYCFKGALLPICGDNTWCGELFKQSRVVPGVFGRTPSPCDNVGFG